MCILFIHVDPSPEINGYRLIIASNRDEYYKRPAQNARLCEETGVIGGRDMEPGREGGMWLGLTNKTSNNTKSVCFSCLLNITGEKTENPAGRGSLVNDYLGSELSVKEYIKTIENNGKFYNGYNFVALELSENKAHVNVHSNTPVVTSDFVGKQTLGLGNSPVNTPLSKVSEGRRMFEEIVDQSLPKDELVEKLLGLLKNTGSHLPDEELKKRAPAAFEMLSSIFVQIGDQYGTRAHTIILIDYDWNIEFIEHALDQPIDISSPKWNVNVIKSHL